VKRLSKIYAVMLYAYPRKFRARFGAEMLLVFQDRCQAVLGANPRPVPLLRFFVATVKDWILSSAKERIASMAIIVLNKWQRRTARGLGVATVTGLALLFITSQVMQAFVISASSMEGSLWMGDHILVNKVAHGGEIGRDDLVVFRYPDNQRQIFVKRVIGLPGDRIRLVDKQVIRNGRRLVEPYARHSMPSVDAYRDNFPTAPAPGVITSPHGLDMLAHDLAGGEVTVPADSLFVLGDNRDNSLDSRYWGFVPKENVVGRPVLVYWRTPHMLKSAPAQEVEP
jgi:signal peptidase I